MNGCPINDPSYDRLRTYLQGHTELKLRWDGTQFEAPYPIEETLEAYSEDFVRRLTKLSTPKGDLWCSSLVGLKQQPGRHERYLLKTPEDAEKYLSLPLPEIGGDVSSFFTAVANMKGDGIVDVGLGFNPAGYVVELFGSETFALMSITDRDLLHCLCERQMAIITRRVKFLRDNAVGPFFHWAGEEYVAPPIHGPTDFCEFNIKYDKPIIDLIHDAGGRVHIHCHGSIKKVLRGFIDMGTDVLHPFEPPPMGDITAREAKALARDRLCLEGNIQIHRMYEATPGAIREETELLIAHAFDDHKGLIVNTTASPYIPGKGEVCFPQYKAMIDSVLHWKP